VQKQSRLLACAYAEHVLHLFEKAYPKDKRPQQCIEIARRFANGEGDIQEVDAAWSAARAAAWSAARAAARAAAGAAAWSAAWSAARAAAWSAARAAAWSAAGAAARAAAGAAARDAARAAEREWQRRKFLEMVNEPAV